MIGSREVEEKYRRYISANPSAFRLDKQTRRLVPFGWIIVAAGLAASFSVALVSDDYVPLVFLVAVGLVFMGAVLIGVRTIIKALGVYSAMKDHDEEE